MWTMDQLVARVSEALAAEYSGAPNGRVRDVPDRRAIRWYTTIGLVDRPLGMRGRTALYGPRHLQQLVTIKRWQAEGRSIAQIQADFVQLTAEGLADAARVPDRLLADEESAAGNKSVVGKPEFVFRPRFWADSPSGGGTVPADSILADPVPADSIPADSVLADSLLAASVPADSVPAGSVPRDRPEDGAAVHGVTLGGGVILLLPHPLTDRDRAEIATAAAPLLGLLESRGLIDGRTS